MRKILFYTAIFILIGHFRAYSQTGAVSISGQNNAPHASAMLDVNSNGTGKGVLISRMSYQQLLTISPVQDGLLVYVTDTDTRGFWYWDSREDITSPNPEGRWVRLLAESLGNVEIVTPPGGIMMYMGNLGDFNASGLGNSGSRMEGWAICNGLNGTPNLMGKFIICGKATNPDYSQINVQGGQDTVKFTAANLPSHNHKIDPAKASGITMKHKHNINDPHHRHSLNTTHSSSANVNDVKRRDSKEPGAFTSSTEKANITLQPNTNSIKFTFPTGFLKITGEGKKMENRPEFIVITYIMKTGSAGASYNAVQNFPY
jgi:microcystin-dependent protein